MRSMKLVIANQKSSGKNILLSFGKKSEPIEKICMHDGFFFYYKTYRNKIDRDILYECCLDLFTTITRVYIKIQEGSSYRH